MKKNESGRFILITVGVTLTYVGVSWLNWALFKKGGILPMPLWPAAGIATALFFRYGPVPLPGVFLGAMFSNALILGSGWDLSIMIGIGNALAPWVVAHGIKRLTETGDPFQNIRDLMLFLFLAVLIHPALTAAVGVSGKLVFGRIDPGLFFNAFRSWYMAHALGTILFSPILLLWFFPYKDPPQAKEGYLVLAAVTLSGSVLLFFFINPFPGGMPYLLIVPMAWVAIRHSMLRTITLFTAVVVIGMTGIVLSPAHGAGDFPSIIPFRIMAVAYSMILLVLSVMRRMHLQAEEAILFKANELDRFFTSSLDLLCIADTDGNFIRVNKEWEKALGYSVAELEARKYFEFIHPEDMQKTMDAVSQLRDQETVWSFTNRYRRKDGSYRYIEWRSLPNGSLIYAAARDITERKRAEELLTLQNEWIVKLSLTGDLEQTLEFCLSAAIRLTGMECGGIYLVDRRTGGLRLAAHQGLSDEFVARVSFIDPKSDRLILIAKGTPLYFDYRYKQMADLNSQEGLRAIAVVPVIHAGKIVACINIASRTKEEFSQEARLMVESTAALIGGFLSRAILNNRLRESEENFRLFFETIDDMIAVTTVRGEILFANRALKQKLGYGESETGSMRIFDIYPSDQEQKLRELFSAMLQGKKSRSLLPLVTKNGESIPVETRIWRGQWNGEPSVFGVSKDLTAEQDAHDRFEKLFRSNPALMTFSILPERRLTEVNDAFLKTLGYKREEVIGKTAVELGLFADPEQELRISSMLRQSGCVRDMELQARSKEGALVDGIFSGEIIVSQGKRYFLSVMVDITGRRRAEAAERENASRLRYLSDNLPGGVVYQIDSGIDGLERRFTYISGGVEALHEITQEEALSDPFKIYAQVHEDDRGRLAEAEAEAVKSMSPFNIEVRVTLPSGKIRWRVFASSPRRLFDNRLVWDGIEMDITDRKRSEDEREKLQVQLNQAQKMESVGRLAGGVAHDFNNMLGAILGYTELALDQVNRDLPLAAYLQEIQKAAERSADLTRQLLAFARKQTVAPQVIDLNETVEGMLKMIRRLIGEDIDLIWKPSRNLDPVKIDPSQIDQILVNLCVNARDAIGERGKLTIETDNVVLDAGYCARHPEAVAGDYVLLAVSDNGSGMSTEVVSRLFEPFFTTKEMGKGTGLGLSTVYGIVTQNNGFINVYSEPGQGTAFKVYLPRNTAKSAIVTKDIKSAPVLSSGGETILLVEDEPSILTMTAEILERLKYSVIKAATPGQAIDMAREHAGEIHLLMTDVVMPEMNGRDLAKSLLSLYPNIKRLFMSGYTANVIAHHGVLDEGVHFIQKPFTIKSLTLKVRETLDHK